jgi:hypothetical protein
MIARIIEHYAPERVGRKKVFLSSKEDTGQMGNGLFEPNHK